MKKKEKDGMPNGSNGQENSHGSQMNAGDMGKDNESSIHVNAGGALTGAEMPSSGMNDSNGGEEFRFPPVSKSPDGIAPAIFEPGLVEVEFRDGVKPKIGAAKLGVSALIASTAPDTNLSELNKLLQRYKLEQAEPSIDTPEEDLSHAHAVAKQADATVPHLANFVTLHFPAAADTQRIAQELSKLPEVERAVAIPKAVPPQTPLNEPLVGTTDQVVLNPGTGLENQWYHFRCRTNQAWNRASGLGVVIADIDWGFRTTHQDLASRLDMSHAYNAFDGGTNVSTGGSVSHGTAVMGIAAGADNNLGMAGFAFDATLWPIQADSGPGTALGGVPWARAIDWVRTANSGGKRKVINLEVQTGSFGNYEMVPSVNAAIRTAIANGIVVCVAAGNGNRDANIDDSGNPIQATGSILVGATEYHATENRRAGFSNFGARVVVCAPGDSAHDITCSNTSDTAYRNGFGGTSGATPKVAGTVALMLEVNPNLTHDEIKNILHNTGTAVITDAAKPVGTFLNAEAAVAMAAGSRSSGPIVAWGSNRLDAFVIGTNSALFHKWWNGSSWGPSVTGYETLGGTIIGKPEVVSWGANRLDVFVTGTDSALYHKWWNGSAWGPSVTGYEFMGGVMTARPKAVAWGPNRLDVFVIGSDSALYHKWWNGSAWGPSVTGYENLGGTIMGEPEVVSWGPNRLDIFAAGTNGALYHKWWNGSAWGPSVTGWENLGGVIKGNPKVVSWGPNRLDIFVTGTDSALYHKWWNGAAWGPSLTGYENMGGNLVGSPEAVSWGANRLDVFVTGTDSALYHKWWNGSAWGPSLTGYEFMGGTLTAEPKAVAWGPNRLDVFVRGTDSAMYHKWWNGAGWGPSVTGYENMGGTIINF